MTNNVDNEQNTVKGFNSFWFGFQKFIWFIVLVTIMFTALVAAFAFLTVKDVYKAEKSVMVMTLVDDGSGTDVHNASLNKKLMPDIKTKILTPSTENLAKEKYFVNLSGDELKEKKITSAEDVKLSIKNVGVSYEESSFIMKISYSDYSEDDAKQKLDAVISATKETLNSQNFSVQTVDVKDLQNDAEITVSNSFIKYVLAGFIGGLLISFVIAVIIKALDTTVQTKEELEAISGANVLSFIDEIAE